MESIKTFLFYDCETTGLPSLENNTTKITELSLNAVNVEHLSSINNKSTFPRVQNKLNLSFNPNKQISQKAVEMTGLSNRLLESQSNFSEDTVKLIDSFIDLHAKPACFVAHNGNKFDYPILLAHLKECNQQLNGDILCVDSMDLFKEIHNTQENQSAINVELVLVDGVDETAPKRIKILKPLNIGNGKGRKRFVSFKLVDVYKRLMGKKAKEIHTAEGDVKLMVECVGKLGQTFISLANKRAKPLNSIPPLKPF